MKNKSDIENNHFKHEEVERWNEVLGGRLHLIHIDVKCIQHIVDFAKDNPIQDQKFVAVFNHFYRILFDRVYVNIYKFIDKRKDVMSLKNYLLKFSKDKRK